MLSLILALTVSQTTWWVAPDGGSDLNSCMAETAPCKKLGTVFTKINNMFPLSINKDQTIVVSAGTVEDTSMVLNDVNVNANITITGPALTDIVDGGALTAVTTSTPIQFVQDTAKGFVDGGLIGYYLVMTSGVSSGVARAIAGNNGNTFLLASPFASAPSIADTYAIRTPAAVFTNSTDGALRLRLTGNSGVASNFSGPTFSITGVDFRSSVASRAGCDIGLSNQSVSLTNVRCLGGSTGYGLQYRGGGQILTSALIGFAGTNGFRFNSTGSTGSAGGFSANFNINNSFFMSHTGVGFDTLSGIGFLQITGSQSFTIQTNSASANVLNNGLVLWRNGTATNYAILRALRGSTGSCYTSINGSSNDMMGRTEWTVGNVYADSCAVGMNLTNNSGNTFAAFGAATGALVCSGAGMTCVSVANGSKVRMPLTFTPQDGGVDISIDGVSFSSGQLTAASPQRLPTSANTTGSSVWK